MTWGDPCNELLLDTTLEEKGVKKKKKRMMQSNIRAITIVLVGILEKN